MTRIRSVTYVVLVRSLIPPSQDWEAIAEVDDYEVAKAMETMISQGFVLGDAGLALRGAGRQEGWMRELPVAGRQAEMTPAEVAAVLRQLKDRDERALRFADKLEAGARQRLES